ncbi:MAG: hypothetical protein GQ535_12875 [Rhodobacteraceae bacterium]|nr:hypothetical protein [Paracoccaceae bacterium]
MTNDTHNANFFVTAWRAYKANIRTAALVSAGLLLVEWLTTVFSSKFAEYAGPTLLVAMFAYAIHYTILFGKNADLKDASSGKPFNKFFWRSMIFFAAFIVIAAVVFLASTQILGENYGPDVLKGWSIILFVLVGLPMFGASFALFGTILPATVAGVDASFVTAWKRAKGNFWYTLLRLALGPFLVQMVILGFVLWGASLGAPLSILTSDGAPDLIGILFYVVVQMANLFVTALAASVLCKTYLRSLNEAPAP